MNRKIYLIGMMILAMLFASCKKEEKTEVQEEFSIMAVTENDGSKTYLDPNSQNPADGYKVKWYVDDVIKVFGSTGDGVDFTCKTVESSGTEANFTSTNPVDDQGEYWAFYPASAVTSLDRNNNTFTFTMDAEQTFKDVSSFADDLFPMAAHYPSGSKSGVKLQFKNAFGILKIHVTRNSPITKIVLTDNNSHVLSGDFTFNPETKTTAAAGNNSNVLTLNIPSNMQSGANAPTDFYMILPPGCLDGAFNLKFYNGSEVVKEINKTSAVQGFAVERSQLKTANVNATVIPSFSVGNNVKVQFAPGNLQYQASSGTWRFAEHQWDFIGGAEIAWYESDDKPWHISVPGGQITGNNTPLSGVRMFDEAGQEINFNKYRDSQDNWIDLFGWGTSGQYADEYVTVPGSISWGTQNPPSEGWTQRQPWCCFNSDHAKKDFGYVYGPIGTNVSISKDNGWAWEVNNILGQTGDEGWRTLSRAEWQYLIEHSKYGFARFSDHQYPNPYDGSIKYYLSGIVLLPDNFSDPKVGGVEFKEASYYANFDDNVYTETTWQLMEAAGAVFLPCGGGRGEYGVANCSQVGHVGRVGQYWSTTGHESKGNAAYYFRFENEGHLRTDESNRSAGLSVRLVRNVSNK